jgi:C-terminal processing protease CtpA/Prc
VPSPTVKRQPADTGRLPHSTNRARAQSGAATQGKTTPGKISKCGLGLTLRNPDDKAGISIKRVKDGGPAALSGKIKPGDRLISVDQVELSSTLSGQDMAKLIVGRKGT